MPRAASNRQTRSSQAGAPEDWSPPGPLAWQSGYAVTVVIAAEGYPAAPRTGDVISGLEEAAEQVNVEVFHAGTSITDDGRIASSGGRVLSVTAHGETLAHAREHAYAAVDLIRLEGSHHRRDIAARAAMEG